VPCLIIEASKNSSCNCNVPGRAAVSTQHQPAVDAAKQDPLYTTEGWNCFCEITQLNNMTAQNLTDCQQNAVPTLSSSNGWCYSDDSGAEAVGNPSLVKNCPDGEKRQIHFVGQGAPDPGSTVFITCEGQ